MEIRFNNNKSIQEARVKVASGFLWKIILGAFYLRLWKGGDLEAVLTSLKNALKILSHKERL